MNKKHFEAIGLFLLMLVLPFFILKEHKQLRAKKQIKCTSKHLKIPHDTPHQTEKSFVIVIPAYNTLNYYEKNLASVLDQIYGDYRIVYLDQGSSDGSLEKVREYIAKFGGGKKIEVIETKEDENPFQIYYNMIHNCRDEEIVIHLDGNDWLAHEKVLSLLNKIYASDDVWMTYGQYLEYPSYKKGIGKKLSNRALLKNKLIKLPWVISHLKTYYAGLFKRIKIHECLSAEELPTLDEVAPFLLPMVKRAKRHVRFIPEVLYVHNSSTSKNSKLAHYAEGIEKPLQKRREQLVKAKIDLILFSQSHPIQLKLCLQSIKQHVSDLGQIIVISEHPETLEEFPEILLISQKQFQSSDYKSFLLQGVLDRIAQSPYVAITTDDVVIQNPISLTQCCAALKKTNAYGFYLHLGRKGTTKQPPLRLIGHQIYAWKIHSSSGHWNSPDIFKMAIYPRNELIKDLSHLSFSNLETLIQTWNEEGKKWDRTGLFVDQSNLFILNPGN